MELRVLHYFLAVAREQSISAAAQSLHLTQPTLSTQLKALEEELGKQLLVRGTKGSRKVTLTEEGMILRKRAEEILTLVNKAEEEIAHSDDTVVGDGVHRRRGDGHCAVLRQGCPDPPKAVPGHPLPNLQRQRGVRAGVPGQGPH